MSELQVVAEERTELGKNASRRIRRSGKLPVVVYGRDLESVSLTVNPRDLIDVLGSEHGRNTIFTVKYAKTSQDVLIRDIQLDPITGRLMHADLQKVVMDQAMTFEIPLEISGESPGVEQGGLLDTVRRFVEVQCLPGDVPEAVFVDISGLEIGDNLRVADIDLDSNQITVLTDPGVVLIAIVAPVAVEEEEEEEEVEEDIEEPEVIQKGKPDEESGAGEE